MKKYWGRIKYWLLGLLALVLLMNTNNNSAPFIQRIFAPISIGNTTFYYAGIIPLVLLFYSVRGILDGLNRYDRKTLSRNTILIFFIILLILPTVIESGVRTTKRFSQGLGAIYTDTDYNRIDYGVTEDNMFKITGTFQLENLGKNDQEFLIKLIIPDYLEEFVSSYEAVAVDSYGSERPVLVKAKESRIVEANFILDLSEKYSEAGLNMSGGGGSGRMFTFYLFNEQEEVVFLSDL